MYHKKATLDLSGCQYADELHSRIMIALDFPDHYGKNLDALWDCLCSDCDINFVSIIGSRDVAQDLFPLVQKILKLFEENRQEWAGTDCPFDFEIIS